MTPFYCTLVYCIYNKHTGITDCRRSHTGVMRCRYSDDDGRTWSEAVTLPFRRSRHDHPNGEVPPNWIAWRQPAFDDNGRALVPFTRRASGAHDVSHDQVECMRLDNLSDDPEPDALEITWLPESGGVTVPGRGRDGGFAQESSIVPLPDGRLFKVMRTNRGAIWYTVSEDGGRNWRETEPLRYVDDGALVKQPVSPAPLYRLDDGRYLLLYNDNDGREPVFTPHRGESGPERFDSTTQNRRPAYVAVGEFRPEAYQPVWFSDPKPVVDNDGVPIDMVGTVPRFDAATYTSLTEVEGERVLWYPDRKHFLLGKRIPDSYLADLQAPDV